MIEYLSIEDLLSLVDLLGVGPVRDLGLLDAAAHRPTTSLYGHDAYVSLDDKAGALLESVVSNHALVDGNKRLGWLGVAVFYDLNGIDLVVDDDAAYDLVVAVAAGELRLPELAISLERLRTSNTA